MLLLPHLNLTNLKNANRKSVTYLYIYTRRSPYTTFTIKSGFWQILTWINENGNMRIENVELCARPRKSICQCVAYLDCWTNDDHFFCVLTVCQCFQFEYARTHMCIVSVFRSRKFTENKFTQSIPLEIYVTSGLPFHFYRQNIWICFVPYEAIWCWREKKISIDVYSVKCSVQIYVTYFSALCIIIIIIIATYKLPSYWLHYGTPFITNNIKVDVVILKR